MSLYVSLLPAVRPRRRGDVATYSVTATDEQVRVCDEWDATWPESVTVGPTGFQDLTVFLEQRGRPGLWSELVGQG